MRNRVGSQSPTHRLLALLMTVHNRSHPRVIRVGGPLPLHIAAVAQREQRTALASHDPLDQVIEPRRGDEIEQG